jgi:hypothetical protein
MNPLAIAKSNKGTRKKAGEIESRGGVVLTPPCSWFLSNQLRMDGGLHQEKGLQCRARR